MNIYRRFSTRVAFIFKSTFLNGVTQSQTI